MAGGWGGYRPGAGRRKGVLKQAAHEARQVRLETEALLREAGPRAARILLARLDGGDVDAAKFLLRYSALTAREQSELAHTDALERMAELAGTSVEALLRGGVNDLLVRAGGVMAFAGLLALAQSGDQQAQRYLCDRYLGEPTQTVTMRSASASHEELREMLYAEYVSQGHSEDEARRLVAMAEQTAESAAGDEGQEEAADGGTA